MGPPPGFRPYSGGNEYRPVAHRKATSALVLGIVGMLCCPIVFSVMAIVFGSQAKNEIDRDPSAYSNRGMATAGIVLGVVGLIFGVLLLIYRFNS